MQGKVSESAILIYPSHSGSLVMSNRRASVRKYAGHQGFLRHFQLCLFVFSLISVKVGYRVVDINGYLATRSVSICTQTNLHYTLIISLTTFNVESQLP